MKALITGASSGIGRDMAYVLASKGYDLIITARDIEMLNSVKDTIKKKYNVQVISYSYDLSNQDEVFELYDSTKEQRPDIVICNAGFGLAGEFVDTNLDIELKMIAVNVKAVHILNKLFLQDMVKRDSGYLLNVSSLAAFQAGPLMSTYYATKVYVLHLTEAIIEELHTKKSNVYVGALCPGPVNTNFNKIAHVRFTLNGQDSYRLAEYTINKMFERQQIIIPGVARQMAKTFGRLLPRKTLTKICYKVQKKKTGKN